MFVEWLVKRHVGGQGEGLRGNRRSQPGTIELHQVSHSVPTPKIWAFQLARLYSLHLGVSREVCLQWLHPLVQVRLSLKSDMQASIAFLNQCFNLGVDVGGFRLRLHSWKLSPHSDSNLHLLQEGCIRWTHPCVTS